MYYPFFRGKQFELIVIRDMAAMLSENNMTPIVEPVRENLAGLKKALDAVVERKGKSIVVINPKVGDFQHDSSPIVDFLQKEYSGADGINVGIVLDNEMSAKDALKYLNEYQNLKPILIHNGFMYPKEVAESLGSNLERTVNIFIDNNEGMLYRRHFKDSVRVLIKDGFESMRNADYGLIDRFSELHLTYNDINVDGFGDFLTVGDSYNETGGPAYAVAIHLTFINSEQDDVMFVYHFVSDDKNSPTDPAGKFAQALNKLIDLLDSGSSMLYETKAISEFRELYNKRHFPGLGVVKKLSMMHHIETLAIYQNKNGQQ